MSTRVDADFILFFAARGIDPPPSRNACIRLRSFILRGNDTLGKDESERIELVKQAQRTWNDALVVAKQDSYVRRFGRVSYVTAFFEYERQGRGFRNARSFNRSERRISDVSGRTKERREPFYVWVRWDDGAQSGAEVGSLRIVKDEERGIL